MVILSLILGFLDFDLRYMARRASFQVERSGMARRSVTTQEKRRGPGIGRLPHGTRRADVARRHPGRPFDIDALRGAAVHREADRAGHYLRRPGGDRHREPQPLRTRCMLLTATPPATTSAP